MTSKIRINFQSGSYLEGVLPTALAATFDYDELPVSMVVDRNGAIERKDNVQTILEDNTVTDVMTTGYVWADDTLWRNLVEELFGSSGLADYDTYLATVDTSTSGTTIYP